MAQMDGPDLTPGELASIEALDRVDTLREMERQVAALWRIYTGPMVAADPRWMAIARTHFSEGFAAMARAVTRPDDPFADTAPDTRPGS